MLDLFSTPKTIEGEEIDEVEMYIIKTKLEVDEKKRNGYYSITRLKNLYNKKQ